MKPILIDLPMPIKTPRLILRPPQLGDGEKVNAAVIESYDTLAEYMPWAKEKPSIEDTEEFVRLSAANWILKRNEEPYLPVFIFDKKTHEFVGGTGYHHFDWDIPYLETGYWLRNSCSGKGYMTEAVNALTQYAFKEMKVKRIAITCDVTNLRSKKIMERLGYSLEGTLKANRKSPLTDELSDTLVYARYDLSKLPDLAVEW